MPALQFDPKRPIYTRRKPLTFDPATIKSDTAFVDLTTAHLPPYTLSFRDENMVPLAAERFDARAAAVVSCVTGLSNTISIPPSDNHANDLLESKYEGKDAIKIAKLKCLAALAYGDYFPHVPAGLFPELPAGLADMVSQAIESAHPGYCGTMGPDVGGTLSTLSHEDGDYDMSQQHLLAIAYRYYDELTPRARDLLIEVLLATGRIRRVNRDDIVTSGGAPDNWADAGFLDIPVLGDLLGIHVKVKRIGETENHILDDPHGAVPDQPVVVPTLPPAGDRQSQERRR